MESEIEMIKIHSISEVFKVFGSFDIDCMASGTNKKADKFFSRCEVPGTSWMDFFHQR